MASAQAFRTFRNRVITDLQQERPPLPTRTKENIMKARLFALALAAAPLAAFVGAVRSGR